MRFPVSTSILLLTQARANSWVGAFSSPLGSFAHPPSAFIHRNNKHKNISSKSTGRTFATADNLKATVSPDDIELDTSAIKTAANASRPITTTSTKVSSFANLSFVDTAELSAKKQHRVLFILGGPGAGKGTQSEKIVDSYKCIHLSVGELLREERKRGDASPHAELIESCLVAGKIVPVEISLNLLKNAMDEACVKSGDSKSYGSPIFLVDGFPRNFDNLAGWTKEMPDYAAVIGSLVYDCPIDVLEKRIMGRAETSGRSDDNLESARKRFKTFQEHTMPVVYALEEVERLETEEDGIGRLHIQHVFGEGSIEEVWDITKDSMDGFVRNDVLTANSLLMQAIGDKNVEVYSQLCSDEYLKGDGDTSVDDLFKHYEMIDDVNSSEICNAKVEVQDGTKAVVTYDRTAKDADGKLVAEYRESRIWSHEERGWACVHFLRKPLSEP
jgi:UMP-CMP kinase